MIVIIALLAVRNCIQELRYLMTGISIHEVPKRKEEETQSLLERGASCTKLAKVGVFWYFYQIRNFAIYTCLLNEFLLNEK